jgi:hypothetical protein
MNGALPTAKRCREGSTANTRRRRRKYVCRQRETSQGEKCRFGKNVSLVSVAGPVEIPVGETEEALEVAERTALAEEGGAVERIELLELLDETLRDAVDVAEIPDDSDEDGTADEIGKDDDSESDEEDTDVAEKDNTLEADAAGLKVDADTDAEELEGVSTELASSVELAVPKLLEGTPEGAASTKVAS